MLQALTPRRVLMTCDGLGGVWRYAADLAAILRAEGAEILLVGVGPRPAGIEPPTGVALRWLDLPPAWMAPDPAAFAPLAAALAALARAFRPDLVHLNQPAEAARLDIDAPVLVAAHSCLATWWRAVRGGEPPADWAWRIALERAGLELADAILAPSRSHAAALTAAYGSLPVRVVPNACAAPPAPAPKEDFVLAAGRWWDPGKNLAALDTAAALTSWPVRLCGALAGPDGPAVAPRHAATLGRLSAEATRALMSRAAIFVSPSLYEPFGLAALEAAHAGCTLALADIPTHRELWDGAAAFADPRDPAALAATLDALARDPARRARLAAAARDRARSFGSERQLTALRGTYAALRVPIPAE